jgi:chromosome segregation ATPase
LVSPNREEGSGLKDIAEDIRNMHSNNRSLKDQNTRLMTVNEKLLEESESLRKEIYRLRTLFGQESYLTTNKPEKPEMGDKGMAKIAELLKEIQTLTSQNQIMQSELQSVTREKNSHLRKINELNDDIMTLRMENNRLQDLLRSNAGPTSQIEALFRQQALDKTALEEAKARARSTEERLALESERLAGKSQEVQRLAQEFDSFRRQHDQVSRDRDLLGEQLKNLQAAQQTPGQQTAQGTNTSFMGSQLNQGGSQPNQGTQGSFAGSQFIPGGQSQISQGTQGLQGSQVLPGQRPSSDEAAFEIERLKMTVGQLERERDIAKKRAKDAEADTAAQLERVALLERQNLDLQVRASQAGQGSQPNQGTRGSFAGSQFIPGGQSQISQGTQGLQGSQVLPGQRPSSDEAAFEIERLKMNLGQLERERDLARKRVAEAEADTAAQLDMVDFFQRQIRDLQLKALQGGTFNQGTSTSFTGSQIIPGHSQINQAGSSIQGLQSSQVLPGQRPSSEEAAFEIERLKMTVGQLERERDIAKKRVKDAEADTAAQLERVALLERQNLDLQVRASQAGQGSQPNQGTRGSFAGSQFIPGGQSQISQGTQGLQGSQVLPGQRPSSEEAAFEIERLKMTVGQLERERDLARKRVAEAEADTAAQLDKVAFLERQIRDLQLKSAQSGPGIQTTQGSRASFAGSQFIPGIQSQIRQGEQYSQGLQTSQVIPSQKPSSDEAAFEIERLKMTVGQLERERDLARKRVAEAEADTAAQLDKVGFLERQIGDMRAKAVQGAQSTGDAASLSGIQVAMAQRAVEEAQRDLQTARKDLEQARQDKKALENRIVDLERREIGFKFEAGNYLKKIQDQQDDLMAVRMENNRLQDLLRSNAGPTSQIEELFRQQALDKTALEEAKARARSTEERLALESERLAGKSQEVQRLAQDFDAFRRQHDQVARDRDLLGEQLKNLQAAQQIPGQQTAQGTNTSFMGAQINQGQSQPNQGGSQPNQGTRGSFAGSQFIPGGQSQISQGTQGLQSSQVLPGQRPSSDEAAFEIERLKMTVGQLERERDLARKRVAEAEADTAAQLDKVGFLERQIGDMRAKAVQGAQSTGDAASLSGIQVAMAQRAVEEAQRDLQTTRMDLEQARQDKKALENKLLEVEKKEGDTRVREVAALQKKINDLQQEIGDLKRNVAQQQDLLKSSAGANTQIEALLRQQAIDKATLEEAKARARSTEEKLTKEQDELKYKVQELKGLSQDFDLFRRQQEIVAQERDRLRDQLKTLQDSQNSPSPMTTQGGRTSIIGSQLLPSQRPSSEEAAFEIERLKMTVGQLERERDIAKKRVKDAEADTAAQLERMALLERQNLDLQVLASQAGQGSQPNQGTRGSFAGSQFIPGGQSQISQGTQGLQSSQVLPGQRPSSDEAAFEIERLKMTVGQLERERDIAKKRVKDAEADTTAQLERVALLERQNLDLQVRASQAGQGSQPNQGTRGSFAGSQFIPGGQSQISQGTQGLQSSQVLPGQRPSSDEAAFEIERLKMTVGQLERERDLARKRVVEAEADTAAQLDNMRLLEKQISELRQKTFQAIPSNQGTSSSFLGSQIIPGQNQYNQGSTANQGLQTSQVLPSQRPSLDEAAFEIERLKMNLGQLERERDIAKKRAKDAEADTAAQLERVALLERQNLDLQVRASQAGQGSQPNQGTRGSFAGSQFIPGGQSQISQGTQGLQSSQVLPGQRPSSDEAAFEIERLKMNLGQLERERDIAKKRAKDADADTAAQLERVALLERQNLDLQVRASQAGQGSQPNQGTRGSFAGSQFIPGGQSQISQGTQGLQSSQVLPGQRPSSDEAAFEIERLKMTVGQLERERDLARKRVAEAEADTAAQLDKVGFLERQIGDMRAKAVQGAQSTGDAASLSGIQLAMAQRAVEEAQRDMQTARKDLEQAKKELNQLRDEKLSTDGIISHLRHNEDLLLKQIKNLESDIEIGKKETTYFKAKSEKLQDDNNKLIDQISSRPSISGIPSNISSSALTFGGLQQSSLQKDDDLAPVKDFSEDIIAMMNIASQKDSELRSLRQSFERENETNKRRITELQLENETLRNELKQDKSRKSLVPAEPFNAGLRMIDVLEENEGMKKLVNQKDREIDLLNKELKNLSTTLKNSPTKESGQSFGLPTSSSLASESAVTIENAKLKSELEKQQQTNTKNQALIEELNDHIGKMTGQLAKQQRLSTISTSDVQLLNENRDLKDTIEKLKDDLEKTERTNMRLKNELDAVRRQFSSMSGIDVKDLPKPIEEPTGGLNEQVISQLNKTISSLNDQIAFKDGVIADLEGRLRAKTGPSSQTDSSRIKASDIEKIKSIVQSQYPGEDVQVAVTLDQSKNYQIDIEKASLSQSKIIKPTDSSALNQTMEKQRITIPSHLFDQIKEVKIESNVDSTGVVIPQTIFSQSFIEGMKVTDVISRPELAKDMKTSQIGLPLQNSTIDQNTAAFFNMLISGEGKTDPSKSSVSVQISKSFVEQPSGKETSLIQSLIGPKLPMGTPKEEPTIIRMSTFDLDGHRTDNAVAVIQPDELKKEQDQIQQTIVNDIILALSKSVIPGENTQIKESQATFFREVPQSESLIEGTQIDKLLVSLVNPQNPEVIQRVSVKDVQLASTPDQVQVEATVQIESVNQDGKLSICEFTFKKKQDGSVALSQVKEPSVSLMQGQKLELAPSQSLNLELQAIAQLMKSSPPAFEAKPGQPIIYKPADDKITIEKLGPKKQGPEADLIRKSSLGKDDAQKSQIQSSKVSAQVVERVIIDPANLAQSLSKLSVIKEDFSANPRQSTVQKLEIDNRGIMTSQVLGLGVTMPATEPQEGQSTLEALRDLNLSTLAQQEVIPALMMSKDPSLAVDPELSQLLPFILPEEAEARQSTFTVRATKDDNDLVFEVYSLITPASPEGQSQPQPTTGVGLVKQRTRIADSSRSGSKWKIIREAISPMGTIQKEEFEVDKVPKADLLKKGYTKPEPKNKSTYRTYRDPKVVKTEDGKEKGLDMFEIAPQSMSWIKSLLSMPSGSKEVILLSDDQPNQEISRLHVPITNQSIFELVEKVVMNKATGQGVHSFNDKNNSMIEEFVEGHKPGESLVTKRVVIGPSNQIQNSEISLMQRSTVPQESDIFSSATQGQSNNQSRRQTIVRESILNHEKSQILVPVEANYDLLLPSSLEDYTVSVKQRNIEKGNDLTLASRLQAMIGKNKCLQLMGSLNQMLTFVDPEIHADVARNSFYLTTVKPEGLIIEKFEVQYNTGPIQDNLVLLSKINFKCPPYSSRLENIEIAKEVPHASDSVLQLSYKLNRSDAPQDSHISRELTDSQVLMRSLGGVSLLPQGAEPQFLRALFAAHEFGSQYLMVTEGETATGYQEWFKVEIPANKNQAPTVKESWVLQKSAAPGVVAIQRSIVDQGSKVEESLVIEKQGGSPAKLPGGVTQVQRTPLALVPGIMKLKKKIKTLKATEGKIKLQESPVEDGFDCLKKQPLSTELRDLIDLAFAPEDKKTAMGEPQRQIMIFDSTNDKAVLKTVAYTPKMSITYPGSPIQDPQTLKAVEISKTVSLKPFASLVAHKMAEESIIEEPESKVEGNVRDSYVAISKIAIEPFSANAKVERFAVTVDPQTHAETLSKVEEGNKPVDRKEQAQEKGLLKRYLDFVCSLLKSPENLTKANSILTQRTQGEQVIIRRADLLKDNKSQDTNGLNLFVREELLVDKCILDALSFTCSDGQGSTNFTSENAAQIIESKIKEYHSSKIPGLIEKLTVRRSSLHEGSLAVDTIRIGAENGIFENEVQERRIHENTEVIADEPIEEHSVVKGMTLALKSMIKERHDLGNSVKTIGLIEEGDNGEVGVSQLKLFISPESEQRDPLSFSLEDYAANKTRKITFDGTSSRYNDLLGKDTPLEAKSESVIIGNKVQVDTVKINSDMSQSKIESFTLPKMPDWETQLNLLQLETAFRHAGASSSKPECFIQRKVEDDQVIYNIVQFEEKNGEYTMKILEHFSLPKKEESVSDKYDRPTMKLSEDYFYNRMASPEKKRPDDIMKSQVQPGQFNIRAEGVKQPEALGNVFQSMGFENPLTTMVDDDDDSVIERKSIRPMVSRSSIMPSKKKPGTRPIMTPLLAVLKSIDHMQLPPDLIKDTVMVQKEEGGKCIFEVLKIRDDPLSGSKTFEPILRLVTPLEKTIFEPMEIIRERLDENAYSKVTDQLRVTPEGDITKISSKQSVYSPGVQTRVGTDAIGVEDVIANLSSYIKVMRQEPFYVKVLDNSPAKLTVETIEIVDKFKELMREKIEIQKDGGKRDKDSLVYNIVRTVATPEGNVQESLEYQKALPQQQYSQTATVTVGKALVSILNAKNTSENPQKPYKNLIRERAQAESLGVTPIVEGRPVDISQIIDLVAKDTGNESFILDQVIDKDKKIINKYKVPEGGKPAELVERFTLDLKQMDNIFKSGSKPGTPKSPEQAFEIQSLPKYFIKGEKGPDGETNVKVFKIVEQKDMNKVSSNLASLLTEEEKKKWKVIITSFEEKPSTKTSVISVVEDPSQPIALLEVKEYTLNPTGQVVKKEEPLGEPVGVTKDGETIYQKQVDIAHFNLALNLPGSQPPAPINVQPAGSVGRSSMQGINMFGSMVQDGSSLPQSRVDQTGTNNSQILFGGQPHQGIGGVQNGFGSMTDLDSETDARARESSMNRGMNPRQSYQLQVHPAPDQVTPQQLANFYQGQLSAHQLSPEEKNKVLEDLLIKLQQSVPIQEAENFRKELNEKDKQISILATSNATADFGSVLHTKDSELKQLRDDKKALQDQINYLSEKITTLQTKIVIPTEALGSNDKLDKALDQELENVVMEFRRRGLLTGSSAYDPAMTAANKGNLKDCIMGSWRMIDDKDKVAKSTYSKTEAPSVDPLISKLREENEDLKAEVQKGGFESKTLKDRIAELEMEKIRGMGIGGPKPQESVTSQPIDAYLTRSLIDALKSLTDKDAASVSQTSSGDPVMIERSNVRNLINAAEQCLQKLEQTRNQVKDLMSELGTLQAKLKSGDSFSQSEMSKTIQNLEKELTKQKDNTIRADGLASNLQLENNRLRQELETQQFNNSRAIASRDNDISSANREVEKLRLQVNDLKKEVIDKDNKILSLTSVQVRAPGGLDQEKEQLKDQVFRLKKEVSEAEDEAKRVGIQSQDLRNQLLNSENRLQQIESSKMQEVASMQKIIDGLRQEKDSVIKLQPVAPIQDRTIEIEGLKIENSRLGRNLKESESKLADTLQREEKEYLANKALKDQVTALELKLIEATSLKVKPSSTEKELQVDPMISKMIDGTLKSIQSLGVNAIRIRPEQIVPVSSGQVESLNQAVVTLSQLIKDEQERQRELEHRLKLAAQSLDSAVNQSSKKEEEAASKIANLTKDLDEIKRQYRDAMQSLQSIQLQPTTPEKTFKPSSQTAEAKLEQERLREELKTSKDRVAALETEVSMLKGKEAISTPKKEAPPTWIKLDDDFDAALKEAKEHGYEALPPTSSEDIQVRAWRATSVLQILKNVLAEKKKLIQESMILNKDLISANERISTLQKSLISEGEKYRAKIEEKDLEIYKLNGELNKLAESIKEQQSGTNPEREKNLEQMMKLKDSELGRLRAETENLRETVKDLKDKNNNLELELIDSMQQKEFIRAEILKLTNSQPDDLPKEEKTQLTAIINSLVESRLIEKPIESNLLYKISMPIFGSMVKGIHGLLEKANQPPPPPPQPDNKLQEISAEANLLRSLLVEERDLKEREKREKEKRELEWKRKEEELMKQLERSVSLDSMNEKVGRLKVELEEKKSIISGLERETKNLKSELRQKEADVDNLDKAISEKSSKLIELDTLRSKNATLEADKKKLEEKERKEKALLEDEIKRVKGEVQVAKINLEGATSRVKDLESQVSNLQAEAISKRKSVTEGDQFSEALRSQAALIASLQNKEKQASQAAAKLAKEKEQIQQALDEAERQIEQIKRQESDSQRQIFDMYDQIDKINEELTIKQREVLEAEKEIDSWKDKLARSKQSSNLSEDEDLRVRLARSEAENQKRRASEMELINKVASLNDEVKAERMRRLNSEAELESKRGEVRDIVIDLESLKSENKKLSERNIELTQKLLIFKSDTGVDEKFLDLEDEMQRLKMHNESLNRKVRELNDDVKSKVIRERSLSKENTDLKEKMKNEEIAKIKRSNTISSSPKRELDSATLPPKGDKDKAPSLSETQKQIVDYGPVHDLKLKNITLQQEINILKNKLKDMEAKEKRDQSMMNILRGSEMKESQRNTYRDEVTPERGMVRPFVTEGEGNIPEFALENMDISIMRDSPSKLSNDRLSSRGKLQFEQTEPMESDYLKLREELRETREQNYKLKNHISLLKSELINVAHNKVPPELTSPMSRPS